MPGKPEMIMRKKITSPSALGFAQFAAEKRKLHKLEAKPHEIQIFEDTEAKSCFEEAYKLLQEFLTPIEEKKHNNADWIHQSGQRLDLGQSRAIREFVRAVGECKIECNIDLSVYDKHNIIKMKSMPHCFKAALYWREWSHVWRLHRPLILPHLLWWVHMLTSSHLIQSEVKK